MKQYQLLFEIKAGINPVTSDLFKDFDGEHWIADQNEILRLTGTETIIPGNYWNPAGLTLRLDQAGTESRWWALDGTILRLGA